MIAAAPAAVAHAAGADDARLAAAKAAAGRLDSTWDDQRQLVWLATLNRCAFSMRQQNRLELAQAIRQHVVREGKALLPATATRLIGWQIDYVDLLLQRAQFDVAESQLLATEQAAGDPASSVQAAKIRRSLIRLYDLWQRPEKADKYRSNAPPGVIVPRKVQPATTVPSLPSR